MVNLRTTRKRVREIPRAPDGSAFQNCVKCGVSVAVALVGMHECGPKKEKVKRFKGVIGFDVEKKEKGFWNELSVMAPFHFFMREFMKARKSGDWIEVDREGFEVWKNMSEKEREPYVKEAEKIDRIYQNVLFQESYDELQVDDEADSTKTAGNNRKFSEVYEDSDNGSSDFLLDSLDLVDYHQ